MIWNRKYPRLLGAAYYVAWMAGWGLAPVTTAGLATIVAFVVAPVVLWELVLNPEDKGRPKPDHNTNEKS